MHVLQSSSYILEGSLRVIDLKRCCISLKDALYVAANFCATCFLPEVLDLRIGSWDFIPCILVIDGGEGGAGNSLRHHVGERGGGLETLRIFMLERVPTPPHPLASLGKSPYPPTLLLLSERVPTPPPAPLRPIILKPKWLEPITKIICI